MKAREIIQFVVMHENEPARQCSCCGGIASWPEMKQARIFPFIDDTEDVCFVVCSDLCERAFMSHPTLDNFVMKAIQEFQYHKDLPLKGEFVTWFQLLNDITLNN